MSAAQDVLSQDEVKALLDGVERGSVTTQSGVAPEGEVRVFDFGKQEARVQAPPEMAAVHDRLVRQLPVSLSLLLGGALEVARGSEHAVTLAEYLSALPLPASVNVVRIKSLNTLCLVTLDAALVFAAVNQFFGGDGRLAAAVEREELTSTEQRMAERVLEHVLFELQAAWTVRLPLEFEFVRCATDLQSIGGLTLTGAIFVAAFDVNLQDNHGQLHIALPAETLEKVSAALPVGERNADSTAWAQRLRARLDDVTLRASCTLLETPISLREVMQLKAGDVIPVELPARVRLAIEGKSLLDAQYGVSRGMYAVKTLSLARPNS